MVIEIGDALGGERAIGLLLDACPEIRHVAERTRKVLESALG
jgi:hypothetical protein